MVVTTIQSWYFRFNDRFLNLLTGTTYPIFWMPSSPDLTTMYFFFLWEYVKNTVNLEKIHHLNFLRGRITAAVKTITTKIYEYKWIINSTFVGPNQNLFEFFKTRYKNWIFCSYCKKKKKTLTRIQQFKI